MSWIDVEDRGAAFDQGYKPPIKEIAMRFMILVKATRDSEAGATPPDFGESETIERFRKIPGNK